MAPQVTQNEDTRELLARSPVIMEAIKTGRYFVSLRFTSYFTAPIVDSVSIGQASGAFATFCGVLAAIGPVNPIKRPPSRTGVEQPPLQVSIEEVSHPCQRSRHHAP